MMKRFPKVQPPGEIDYRAIPILRARATAFLKRNGVATIDNLVEIGLSREYVSQLCSRAILRRNGHLYYLVESK